MITREEVELAKERISRALNNVLFSTLYSQEENEKDEEILLKYIKELEHEKDIMQRAFQMQSVGWSEGAKLFAEKANGKVRRRYKKY